MAPWSLVAVRCFCRCKTVFVSCYRTEPRGMIWTQTPCPTCKLNFRIEKVEKIVG